MINKHTLIILIGIFSIGVGIGVSLTETSNGTAPMMYILLGVIMIYLGFDDLPENSMFSCVCRE